MATAVKVVYTLFSSPEFEFFDRLLSNDKGKLSLFRSHKTELRKVYCE